MVTYLEMVTKVMINVMISIFPSSTSLNYVAICHQYLLVGFTSLSLFDIHVQERALHTYNILCDASE